jgi:hypothetical protein
VAFGENLCQSYCTLHLPIGTTNHFDTGEWISNEMRGQGGDDDFYFPIEQGVMGNGLEDVRNDKRKAVYMVDSWNRWEDLVVVSTFTFGIQIVSSRVFCYFHYPINIGELYEKNSPHILTEHVIKYRKSPFHD